MVWTAPSGHTYTTAETVTAATLNTYVGANLTFVYGDTAWTAATLINSWANVGGGFSVAAYRLAGTTVKLRGRIKSGTIAVVAFVLPAGYRPVNGALILPAVSGTVAGACLVIDTSGNVAPTVGVNTDFAFTCEFDILN